MESTPGHAVLVVEDEFLVRMLAVDVLLEAGFEVIEACSGNEALKLVHDRDDLSALFTDIEFTDSIDGLELAHAARGVRPWLPIIIVSGRVAPTPAELPHGARFMGKPYQLPTVIGTIVELIGAGRAASWV